MRGPKPQYPIQLTSAQEQMLRQMMKARKTPQVKVLCARILLAAHDHSEWRNQQIAGAAGTVDRVVRKWRKRWVETHSVEDLPRPGAPRRFPP